MLPSPSPESRQLPPIVHADVVGDAVAGDDVTGADVGCGHDDSDDDGLLNTGGAAIGRGDGIERVVGAGDCDEGHVR